MQESWDDDHTVHAELGSYRANAYGLHDVHGNVWEWCLDSYSDYTSAKRVNPVAPRVGSAGPVNREGCFNVAASDARSANRYDGTLEDEEVDLGLRPARAISPEDFSTSS